MFLIRENAMKILADVYQHCDSNFNLRYFNSDKYIKEMGDDNFIKSIRYLWQSNCIEKPTSAIPTSITITTNGIDKLEDYIIEHTPEQE